MNTPLHMLPENHQSKLELWLASHTYLETVHLAAQPLPDGLGIQTTISALSRFYARRATAASIDQAMRLDHSALLLTRKRRRQTALFSEAALEALQRQLFEKLLLPSNAPECLALLSQTLQRVSNVRAQERRLRLAESKWKAHRDCPDPESFAETEDAESSQPEPRSNPTHDSNSSDSIATDNSVEISENSHPAPLVSNGLQPKVNKTDFSSTTANDCRPTPDSTMPPQPPLGFQVEEQGEKRIIPIGDGGLRQGSATTAAIVTDQL